MPSGGRYRRAVTFTREAVHWFLDLVDAQGFEVWLDGGWGVDALLGRQTRPHGNLDIAIRTADGQALRERLAEQGFTPVDPGARPWNFVEGHPDGRLVDFHLIDLDEHGDGRLGPHGDVYPSLALTGRGTIDGRPVRCIEASSAVRFHTGYRHDDNDAHDVGLLCEAFGLELPDQYR